MSPSTIDKEFRSLAPEAGGHAHSQRQLLSLLGALLHQLRSRQEFELTQAYLGLALKVSKLPLYSIFFSIYIARYSFIIRRCSTFAEHLCTVLQLHYFLFGSWQNYSFPCPAASLQSHFSEQRVDSCCRATTRGPGIIMATAPAGFKHGRLSVGVFQECYCVIVTVFFFMKHGWWQWRYEKIIFCHCE